MAVLAASEPLPVGRSLQLQVPAFLFVGGLTFCVDAALLQTTYWLGTRLEIATTLGYVVGLCVHFTLNRRLTFQATHGRTRRQIGLYLTNALVCYLLTQVIVNGGHWLWPIEPVFWKAAAVGVTMTLTFVWLKMVAFAGR